MEKIQSVYLFSRIPSTNWCLLSSSSILPDTEDLVKNTSILERIAASLKVPMMPAERIRTLLNVCEFMMERYDVLNVTEAHARRIFDLFFHRFDTPLFAGPSHLPQQAFPDDAFNVLVEEFKLSPEQITPAAHVEILLNQFFMTSDGVSFTTNSWQHIKKQETQQPAVTQYFISSTSKSPLSGSVKSLVSMFYIACGEITGPTTVDCLSVILNRPSISYDDMLLPFSIDFDQTALFNTQPDCLIQSTMYQSMYSQHVEHINQAIKAGKEETLAPILTEFTTAIPSILASNTTNHPSRISTLTLPPPAVNNPSTILHHISNGRAYQSPAKRKAVSQPPGDINTQHHQAKRQVPNFQLLTQNAKVSSQQVLFKNA